MAYTVTNFKTKKALKEKVVMHQNVQMLRRKYDAIIPALVPIYLISLERFVWKVRTILLPILGMRKLNW